MGIAHAGGRIVTLRRAATLACAALLAALALSGCSAPTPEVTPIPEATTKPLFATDAEALAAAEAAYAAYLTVSDQILADGGQHLERIEGLAVRNALKGLEDSVKSFRKSNLRIVGASQFDSTSLQHGYESGGREDVVAVYLCLDVGNVDVLDAAGSSVVSITRPDRQSFEVSFDVASTPEPHLVLSSRIPWSQSYCQ